MSRRAPVGSTVFANPALLSSVDGNDSREVIARNRIGEPSTDDEVRGYWVFALGVIFAVSGFLLFLTCQTTGDIRQWAIVILGAGLVLLIAGPVIRLPLRRLATGLVYLGVVLSAAAIVWFVMAYMGRWSQESGNLSIMLLYGVGLLTIAVSGVFVPILTAREEIEAKVSELEEELYELQETLRASEAKESKVAGMIADVQSDLEDTKADTVALEREIDQLRMDVVDTEADEADLAAILSDHRDSQSQFELYEDQGEQWRWRLRHRNGNILATASQGYVSLTGVWDGIESVKRNAPDAELAATED